MPRAPRPPAEGPFPVPLATIDWLVSRENPGVRAVALRDLLARPPKDPDVRRARQAAVRDPFLRDLLALVRARLVPAPQVPLERRYDGGMWLALFLTEFGVDEAQPALRHAADVLLARWEKAFVEIERGKVEGLDVPLFSAALRVLARTGRGPARRERRRRDRPARARRQGPHREGPPPPGRAARARAHGRDQGRRCVPRGAPRRGRDPRRPGRRRDARDPEGGLSLRGRDG